METEAINPPVEDVVQPFLVAEPAVASEPTIAKPGLRLLPVIAETESAFARHLFLIIAIVIAASFAYFAESYSAPAPCRPGIDENAYLLAGKNIAQHGTVGFKPADEFQFIDLMWVRTADQTFTPPHVPAFLGRWLSAHTREGWYYPKYPAGVPLLNAIAIWLGGARHGLEWTFQISPICMTLAALGMFFLTRTMAGSFYGVLAMIMLVTGNTSLEMLEVPGSHAPTLAIIVWGMFLLIRWWQTGSLWWGLGAGFLLGFAVTCRYTEALLLFPLFPLDQVLSDTSLPNSHPHWWALIKVVRLLPIGPIALAVLGSIRWRNPRTILRAIVPIAAWTVPVAILLIYNWFTMGHVTGYDTTNESAGFNTGYMLGKWDFTIEQVYLFGVFLLAPLGIAGMIVLFQRNARIALVLLLWFVPGALLYTAYYWGNGMQGVAYLRFFMTLFPPLIVAAMWVLGNVGWGAGANASNRRRIAGPIAAGVLVAAAASISLANGLPDLERQHRGNLNLRYSETIIKRQIDATNPTHARPVAFTDFGALAQLTQYVQFMIDADWYTSDAFELRAAGGFGVMGMDSTRGSGLPVLIQRDRIDHMTELLKGKSAADLVKLAHVRFDDALEHGRPAYAILTATEAVQFRVSFITSGYQMTALTHWAEPCSVHPPFTLNRQLSPPTPTRPNWLAPAFISGEPWIRWEPEALTMFQITRKPATEPATTQSTSTIDQARPN